MRRAAAYLAAAACLTGLLTGCGGGAAVSGENDDPLSRLTPAGSMELSYTEQFTVDTFEGGLSLITIGGEDRYLVVPEGQQAPQTGADITVLQQPLDSIYLVATSAMDFFVSLDAAGNREFSFYRNPSADLFLDEKQITPEMFESCAVLHFCSVDLVDYPVRGAHRRAIELAKQAGAFISFDPNVRLPLWSSPADCQAAIRQFLPCADLVKLSDDEIEFVTGCADERAAAEKLFALGVRMVVVTRGANGSAAYTPSCHAETATISVPVTDTTGAGDSFIGSFLYQLTRDGVSADELASLSEQTLAEFLRFSARCASFTVQHRGAVMPTQADLRAACPG